MTLAKKMDKRFALIGTLLAGLLITGLGSLAAINDTLNVTNDFSVINADITANSQNTLAFTYQFSGTGNEVRN